MCRGGVNRRRLAYLRLTRTAHDCPAAERHLSIRGAALRTRTSAYFGAFWCPSFVPHRARTHLTREISCAGVCRCVCRCVCVSVSVQTAMGQILTYPLTSKLMQRHGNESLRVGVSEMQGYRVNMEVRFWDAQHAFACHGIAVRC